VVIVDDAAEVRGLVRTHLRLSGRFVVLAEGRNGVEAVDLCREHQPDFVLLDISMPEMDGLEALPRIRRIAPRTRVVMYTGFDEAGLGDRARELGATALVEKSTVISGLAGYLEALRADPPPPPPPPPPVAAPSEPPAAEPDEGTDSGVLEEHLERFREVFDEAAIGMATMTLTGRVVRANKALADVVACPVDELIGKPYAELAPEPDRAAIGEALHRAQDGIGAVVQVEHGVLSAPVRKRVLSTAAPVRDARGRPLYLFLQSQDVTAQRLAEEELRQSEQRFALLVEAVEDYAIFMLDPDGRVASWNRGAQRIKGYESKEIIGQHFRVFYPQQLRDVRHPENELELARTRGVYEEEGWRIRKDGSSFWASVVITAVFDQDGNHVGFAKVTRDIDERRQMLLDAENSARALATANNDLQAANARLAREAADQAQFLAVTAHELRSPIGVLAGSAQLLLDHVDDLTAEERAELAQSITGSADRLQRLLRDLLTAARLEARAVHIDMDELDVGDLLTRAVSGARAGNANAEIRVEVPAGLRVSGERDRLAQALDNLITNALRHGAAPVTVRGVELDDRVEISVSDSGSGVPRQVQDRLFERFASGTPSTGTGLGLFIVRELVRAHGGDARYEVDPQGRPTFVLALPKVKATAVRGTAVSGTAVSGTAVSGTAVSGTAVSGTADAAPPDMP